MVQENLQILCYFLSSTDRYLIIVTLCWWVAFFFPQQQLLMYRKLIDKCDSRYKSENSFLQEGEKNLEFFLHIIHRDWKLEASSLMER